MNVPYEIIVTNNNPDDNMKELLDLYSDNDLVSLYSNEENYGQVGNINQGFILSKAPFVSILHDDDILLPNYLDSVVPYLTGWKIDCLVTSNLLLEDSYHIKIKHKYFILHA